MHRSCAHTDLTEMTRALHVRERLPKFAEAEGPVHDRPQLVKRDGAVHRLEHRPAADEDPLETDVLHENGDRIDLARAGEDADEADRAAAADRLERLPERAGAADFDDVIDAGAA